MDWTKINLKGHSNGILSKVILILSFLALCGTISTCATSISNEKGCLKIKGRIDSNLRLHAKEERFDSKHLGLNGSDGDFVVSGFCDSLVFVATDRRILCVNVAAKKVQWSYEILHRNSWGAVLVRGKKVLLISPRNDLCVLNAYNGTLLQVIQSQHKLYAIDAADGEFAYCSSVDHRLVAVDYAVGKILWATKQEVLCVPGSWCWNDRLLYGYQFGAASKPGGPIAINRRTGAVEWRSVSSSIGEEDNGCWLILTGRSLLFSLRARGHTGSGVVLVSVDSYSGRTLWRKEFSIVSSVPVYRNGILYGETLPSTSISAIRLKNMSVRWSSCFDLSGNHIQLTGLPVVLSQHELLCPIAGTKLVSLDATTGRLLWVAPYYSAVAPLVGPGYIAYHDVSSNELVILRR